MGFRQLVRNLRLIREREDRAIRKSHKMTEWKASIVTIGGPARFGWIRKCESCEAEQIKNVIGIVTDEALGKKCESVTTTNRKKRGV